MSVVRQSWRFRRRRQRQLLEQRLLGRSRTLRHDPVRERLGVGRVGDRFPRAQRCPRGVLVPQLDLRVRDMLPRRCHDVPREGVGARDGCVFDHRVRMRDDVPRIADRGRKRATARRTRGQHGGCEDRPAARSQAPDAQPNTTAKLPASEPAQLTHHAQSPGEKPPSAEPDRIPPKTPGGGCAGGGEC